MRLLNSESLRLREFYDDSVPLYAILSHTWEDDEVTFQDLTGSAGLTKAGFSKIRACCSQAIRDGYEWIWVDTCCIDKTSSAELSEAINSMFRWYRESAVCYVYLSDLPPQSPGRFDSASFMAASWFTRGWTLQELIAPHHVEFYDQAWNDVGTKTSLMDLIHERTGIRCDVLSGRCLLTWVPVAERMSWASNRKTSRREDIAYCLLGIFDIHMPLLYGEGPRAFVRLQQEILRNSEDLSILLWARDEPNAHLITLGVLAPSPDAFDDIPVWNLHGKQLGKLTRSWSGLHSSKLVHERIGPPALVKREDSEPPTITSRGLRTRLPRVGDRHGDEEEDVEGLYACTMGIGPVRGVLKLNHDYLAGYLCIKLTDKFPLSRQTGPIQRAESDRLYLITEDDEPIFTTSSPMYINMDHEWPNFPPRIDGIEVVFSHDYKSLFVPSISRLAADDWPFVIPGTRYIISSYCYIEQGKPGIFHVNWSGNPGTTHETLEYNVIVAIAIDDHQGNATRRGKDHIVFCASADQDLVREILSKEAGSEPGTTYIDLLKRSNQHRWADRYAEVLPGGSHVFQGAIKVRNLVPRLIVSIGAYKESCEMQED
ncbi:HET domain-containing protein [Colletotrichum higginsianum]|uniref:HET domain-containing protein n=1 Tax=Colletotrichum higginsianum (strain IMI 349063) TaxID=759273 RepID=H1V9V1_COLHI|nr:HET domain-containing protein [Colletotrichum higginsianum IMI 349063]OBR10560.1 HET domain-containing protein [Colletotrichum higginsianum IMI 349063]CCF37004.1 HET domain-containing protein [Colletotrichum higginsianum]